jgi:hypothetical protein
MAHRARYSGRPALRPSGHQQITLMFKIAPGNFTSHSASSPKNSYQVSGPRDHNALFISQTNKHSGY